MAYRAFKKNHKPRGPKVVLGLTKGAIHDMGKNVVKIFLEANGFNVIDVGKCAEPQAFMEAARIHKPKVVGISIPVTTAEKFLKTTVKLIRKVSPKSKIVIGGCAINEEWVKRIGADAYGDSAEEAVEIFRRLAK